MITIFIQDKEHIAYKETEDVQDLTQVKQSDITKIKKNVT